MHCILGVLYVLLSAHPIGPVLKSSGSATQHPPSRVSHPFNPHSLNHVSEVCEHTSPAVTWPVCRPGQHKCHEVPAPRHLPQSSSSCPWQAAERQFRGGCLYQCTTAVTEAVRLLRWFFLCCGLVKAVHVLLHIYAATWPASCPHQLFHSPHLVPSFIGCAAAATHAFLALGPAIRGTTSRHLEAVRADMKHLRGWPM